VSGCNYVITLRFYTSTRRACWVAMLGILPKGLAASALVIYNVLYNTLMRPDSYPQPGDQLFPPGPASATKRPPSVEGGWVALASSYKHAADRLAHLADTNAALVDPTLFLYRHFLELRLKMILGLGFIALDDGNAQKNVDDILRTHDLDLLLQKCHEVCEALRVFAEEPRLLASFNASKNCIHELAAVDRGSYAFRYPIDKKLKPSIGKELSVSMPHLRQMIGKLENFLELLYKRMHFAVAEHAGENNDWSDEDMELDFKDLTGQDELEAAREQAE